MPNKRQARGSSKDIQALAGLNWGGCRSFISARGGLVDTNMETWLQRGATGYDPFKTNASQAGCFLCHNQPSAYGGASRQVDMSHFPGKLPPAKLEALNKALVEAGAMRNSELK